MTRIDPETWSTHDEAVNAEIASITKRLVELLDVAPGGADAGVPARARNIDEATTIIITARRQLLLDLLHLETHEHWLDDCGDDTQAATDRWGRMFWAYFDNDADPEATVMAVNEQLDDFAKEYGMEEDR